jgi:hypothetical protein
MRGERAELFQVHEARRVVNLSKTAYAPRPHALL